MNKAIDKTIKVNTNIVFGILAIIIAVLLWIIIPSQIKETTMVKDYVSARFFPKLIAGIMCFCGIICIAKGIIVRKTTSFNIFLEVKALVFLLVLIAYAVCAFYISFILSSILFALGSLIYMKTRNVKKFIIAIVIAVIACLIFKYVLDVKFDGIWGI